MNCIPVIDMAATGINITRLRVNAGLTVKDLQDIFRFEPRRAYHMGECLSLVKRGGL